MITCEIKNTTLHRLAGTNLMFLLCFFFKENIKYIFLITEYFPFSHCVSLFNKEGIKSGISKIEIVQTREIIKDK